MAISIAQQPLPTQRSTSPTSVHFEAAIPATIITLTVMGILIAHQGGENVLRTIALAVAVTFVGILMIYALAVTVRDRRIGWLIYVYLVKLLLTLALLYWGWVPDLHPSQATYGYDPQRYYYQSAELLQHGRHDDILSSLNYAGVLYYYAAIFALFGHNPAAPALVNSLFTLLAALILVEAAHIILPASNSAWKVGLVLLVPEILWYDALTSRETITMALLVCGTVPLGMVLVAGRPTPRSTRRIFGSILSLTALGLIRTSVLPVAFVIVAFYYLFFCVRGRQRLLWLAVIGAVVTLIWISAFLVTYLRAYDFSYVAAWRNNRELLSSESIVWSERSIGQLLVPRTWWQEFVFAPLRMAAYLITPLPSVTFDLSGLIHREWQDWQNFLTSLSSLMYVWCAPHFLTLVGRACFERRERLWFLILGPAIISLAAVAMGNVILTPRYRIMAIGFLWPAIAVFHHRRSRTYLALRLVWYACVITGVVCFVAIKS